MSVSSRYFSLALNVTSDGHPPSEATPPSVAFSPPSLVSWSLCYRMINLMLNLEAVFLAQRERDYWQREREWKTESKGVCVTCVAGLLSTTNPFAKRQHPPLTRAIVVTDFPLYDLFICGYFNCVLLLYLVHFCLGTQTVGQAFMHFSFCKSHQWVQLHQVLKKKRQSQRDFL